jgi:PAS domain S-box-containing protein
MPTEFENLVLQESPDAVVIVNLDGKIVHWTKGAEQVFGYASEEAVGKAATTLLVPAERHEEERRLTRLILDDGTYSYESIRCRKDGSLVYVDISAKAVRDACGAPVFILISQKDVTALKVLRDAKLLETKFRDVLESMPDGIIMANSTGYIVLANSQAEKLSAIRRANCVGNPLSSYCRAVSVRAM